MYTAEAFPDKVITTGASISKSDAILTFGKEYVSISLEGVFPNYTELEAVKLKLVKNQRITAIVSSL